ncbi:hypothetical protein P3T42_002113 [Paraburkholderia sp. GAS38]|uniref:SIR2 family protein n=1 Tax=Paraburkholderia sp. GAS38 TaxID=3035133 RepID=UPI003D1B7B26
MPRFLLLGAGFSRNWGGWLASEVADDLLWRLRARPQICQILVDRGFEDAFHEMQTRFRIDNGVLDDLLALQTAIEQTFRAMNMAFVKRAALNFSNEGVFSVIEFLARFDAIFTLNQDLLLEMHYVGVELANSRRWTGVQWPGVHGRIGAGHAGTPLVRQEMLDQRSTTAREAPAIENGLQPIIKLHGSSNWYDGEGVDRAPTMVIGGEKRQAIQANPLLRFYGEYFRDRLSEENALLMTIGYGFADEHINDAICDAHEVGNNFGLFVVNPSGRKVLDKRNPHAQIQDHPGRLMDVRYVGGSSRPLSTTFAGDTLEHGKLLRFFLD